MLGGLLARTRAAIICESTPITRTIHTRFRSCLKTHACASNLNTEESYESVHRFKHIDQRSLDLAAIASNSKSRSSSSRDIEISRSQTPLSVTTSDPAHDREPRSRRANHSSKQTTHTRPCTQSLKSFRIQSYSMNGTVRANIARGAKVSVVLKCDQPTGKLTVGIVDALLTNSPQHHQGIKVRLRSGQVGRVQIIHEGEANTEFDSTQPERGDGRYSGRRSPSHNNRTNNRNRRSPNSQRHSPAAGSVVASNNAYRDRNRRYGTRACSTYNGDDDDSDVSAYMRPSSAEGNVLSAWVAPQLDDQKWTNNESQYTGDRLYGLPHGDEVREFEGPNNLSAGCSSSAWSCSSCTFANSSTSRICEMCASVRPAGVSECTSASDSPMTTINPDDGTSASAWTCGTCTYINDNALALACAICFTPRTG